MQSSDTSQSEKEENREAEDFNLKGEEAAAFGRGGDADWRHEDDAVRESQGGADEEGRLKRRSGAQGGEGKRNKVSYQSAE